MLTIYQEYLNIAFPDAIFMTAKLSIILQILNRYIEPKGSGWKPGSFQVRLHFLY